MERLLIAFPNFSRKTIEKIDSIIEYERWSKKKIDNIKRQVNLNKNELREKVELLLKNDVEKIKSDVEQKLEMLKQEAKLRKIKEKHEENFEKYQEKMTIINDLQKRKLEEENMRNLKKQKEWEEHAEEIKIKATEFKENKQKERSEKEKLELELLQKEQDDLKKKIEENREKVEDRNENAVDKIKKKIEDKERQEKEKEENKQKLNNAIENYKFRPKVEADEKRLEQITEAMKIRKDTGMDSADTVKLFKDYGYTTDQLMKDLRFKMSAVLAVFF